MTKTQDTELPVSHGQMAGMLGMAKETLSYYCRIGKIPRHTASATATTTLPTRRGNRGVVGVEEEVRVQGQKRD